MARSMTSAPTPGQRPGVGLVARAQVNRAESGCRLPANAAAAEESARRVTTLPPHDSASHAPAEAASARADEIDLVGRIAGGDTAAFRRIVERHIATVTGIAARMLNDGAEAEDVAQETMIRLWKGANGLAIGPSGVRPWLIRVASNLSIDRLRSRRFTTLDGKMPETRVTGGQDRTLDEQDLSRRVTAALAALPERQRLALVLFHFQELSQDDVAEAMEVSAEAVESLLSRARRALRAALADEWRQLLPDDDTHE